MPKSPTPSEVFDQVSPMSVERKTPFSSLPARTVRSSEKPGLTARADTATPSNPTFAAFQARPPFRERYTPSVVPANTYSWSLQSGTHARQRTLRSHRPKLTLVQ